MFWINIFLKSESKNDLCSKLCVVTTTPFSTHFPPAMVRRKGAFTSTVFCYSKPGYAKIKVILDLRSFGKSAETILFPPKSSLATWIPTGVSLPKSFKNWECWRCFCWEVKNQRLRWFQVRLFHLQKFYMLHSVAFSTKIMKTLRRVGCLFFCTTPFSCLFLDNTIKPLQCLSLFQNYRYPHPPFFKTTLIHVLLLFIVFFLLIIVFVKFFFAVIIVDVIEKVCVNIVYV